MFQTGGIFRFGFSWVSKELENIDPVRKTNNGDEAELLIFSKNPKKLENLDPARGTNVLQ